MEIKPIVIMRENAVKGWRRGRQHVGRPDLVFPRQRFALFADRCFWHGCRWHFRMPETQLLYWQKIIEDNQQRDKAVRGILIALSWTVLRIWVQYPRNPKLSAQTLKRKLATPDTIPIANKEIGS
jgi:DNA mismatch endonuclease (patch repair protein)